MNAPVLFCTPLVETLHDAEGDSSLDTFLAQLERAPQPLGLESDLAAFPPSEDVVLPSVDPAVMAISEGPRRPPQKGKKKSRKKKRHRTQVVEPQVRPGSHVGPYQLTKELGRGGMGVVFQAQDADGRAVAIKLVLSLDHPRHLARFEREGQITAALDHPGVIRIHAAGEHHGMPYLVYELVEEAQTLDDVFEYYSLEERAELVRDAAWALGHAHDRGVVHRDVKPENILLDVEGRVRIADFGLAEGRGLKRLTREGTFLGTPGFAAPEQLTGRWMQIGPHSDVWSLGAVLYFVFTGRLPFNGRTFNELAHRTTTGMVRPPSRFAPNLPEALEEVCLKALSRSPRDRYADAAELAADLDRALAGEPLAPHATRRRPLKILAAAAGLLLTCTAVAFGRTTPARIDVLEGPAAWTADPTLAGNVEGVDLDGLSLSVAGQPTALHGRRFEATCDLPDGAHQVELVLRRGDVVLARELRTLQLDRSAPELQLSGPRPHKLVEDGKLWVTGRVDDVSPVRVGVTGGAELKVAPGQAFKIPVELHAGRNAIRVWAADEAGNLRELERTVWVPPAWYLEADPARRAPLPLPEGVAFGERPGEYRHQATGAILVWVWLETFERTFQREAGPPRNFQMSAGPFVAFREGFFLGKHEVTWGQFVAFAAATGHTLPRPAESLPADHPASGISWFDAMAFCAWAKLRLPTEAQWEYAARSSRQHVWPWGDRARRERANLRGTEGRDRYPASSPVGSFPAGASRFGCHDMAGNVWEWTADWAGPLSGNRVLVDPTGPKTGTTRILRGGSYRTLLKGARAGLRARQDPHLGRPTSGFRVMLTR